MEFKRINVTESEQFDYLYNDSALTLEGLTEDSIGDFIDWIAERAEFKTEPTAYVIKGRDMNNHYGLTGDNAYPNDLSIVSVPLEIMENPGAIVIPRFQIGGRWFDDIVENNLRRERGDF